MTKTDEEIRAICALHTAHPADAAHYPTLLRVASGRLTPANITGDSRAALFHRARIVADAVRMDERADYFGRDSHADAEEIIRWCDHHAGLIVD